MLQEGADLLCRAPAGRCAWRAGASAAGCEAKGAMEGTCRVYKSDALRELVVDAADETAYAAASEAHALKARPRNASTSRASQEASRRLQEASDDPRLSAAARKLAQKQAREARYREETEQLLRDTERWRAEKAKRREDAFQTMYASVCDGLDGEGGVVGEVTATLENNARLRRKKTAALYAEWKEEVFDKIQASVEEQMGRVNIKESEQRRAKAYDAYIRTVNSKAKGGVFRDIIIPTDYDPLTLREHTLKYNGTVRDPMKRDLHKAAREKRDMGVKDMGTTQARQTLDVIKWAAENIGSTPYGHDSHHFDDDGNFIDHHTGYSGNMTSSSVSFDHYNPARGREIVEKEQKATEGKGKRVFPGRRVESNVHF